MIDKTCCFTGHRKIAPSEYGTIKAALQKAVEDMISKGIIFFGCGGALGFDMLAAETVLKLKELYPQIKLIMVYPCKNQELFWDEASKKKYAEIKKMCDKYVYVSDEYSDQCMCKRNRHLVNHSSYCICYCKKNFEGAAYTVKYAERKGLEIINIAKTTNPPHRMV